MKKVIGLIIGIVLSYWSMNNLLGPGYFPMHDDTQVARVIVMGNALKHGQFPVRWVSDLGYGYGYPLYNFYGPLPYYFGGSLYALGIDSVLATKWMFGIGILLAGVTMYICLYPMMGIVSAIVGSLIFLYAPYHAVQIYIRGSVGEYWAIAFVPLIISGIWHSYNNRNKKGFILGSVGLSGTILSHTILGFITTGLVGLLIAGLFLKRRNWYILMIGILGCGLSAFFWLPALFEMSYTSVSRMISSSTTTFTDHFICLSQLWNAPWGFGGSAAGCTDGMSFKIGKFHSIVFILSFGILLLRKSIKRLQSLNKIIWLTALFTLFILFLTLPYSSFIWNMFPMSQFIQYPWRLLSFVTVGIGIMSAYIVASHKIPIVRYMYAIILLFGLISINGKLFVPQYEYIRDSYQFETKEELRFRISKISDEYIPIDIQRPRTSMDIVNSVISESPTLTVKEIQNTETVHVYEVTSTIAQSIQLKLAYFPGWNVRINGQEVTPTIARGLPSVLVSEGLSIIEMKFTNTPIRTIANLISLITVIIIIILIFTYGKKTNA